MLCAYERYMVLFKQRVIQEWSQIMNKLSKT